MPVATFAPDQLMAILAWLEDQQAAGLDLDEIIKGLENGYLSARVTITDKRHTSFSKQSEDLFGVSKEI